MQSECKQTGRERHGSLVATFDLHAYLYIAVVCGKQDLEASDGDAD